MSINGSPKSQAAFEQPRWVKSSLSFANNNCVEVQRQGDGGALVRNSRDPEGGVLEFTADEWDAFIGGCKQGEFDPAA